MALTDGVSFTAASPGTGSFVFGSARDSFLNPTQAVALGTLSNGQTVSYLAQDSLSNPVQREWGHGTFFSSNGGVIVRNNVGGSISNGVSGSSVLNFSAAPIVSLTLLSGDASALIDTNIGSSQGMVLYRSSVAWSALSAGMAGQFLQTQGLGANPQWSTVVSSVVSSTITINLTPTSGGTNNFLLYDNAGVVGERFNPYTAASSNMIWYVASSGNDTNSGSSVAPFATVQHGLNTAALYDYQFQFWPEVSVADGTYASSVQVVLPELKNPLRGAHAGLFGGWLVGDKAAPANVIIGPVIGSGGDCIWAIEGFQLQGTSLAGCIAEKGAFIQPGSINHNGSFGTMWLARWEGMLYGTNSGVCTIVSTASGATWLTVLENGMVDYNGEAHHLPGSNIIPFATGISAGPSGYNFITIGNNFDFGTGTTGPKVNVGAGTLINTANGLLSDIPGTTAGITADFTCNLTCGENDFFTSNLSQGHAFPLLLSTQNSTSYTLGRINAGGVVEMNSSIANTLIVPGSSQMGAATFPVNTRITVVQVGAGATTISAAAGVTIHNAGALTGQFASATIYNRANNEWVQINGSL